jgi:hypothetical protein
MEIILGVAFYALGVGVSFFTVAAQVERLSITNDVHRALEGLFETLEVVTPEESATVRELLQSSLVQPSVTKEGGQVAEGNRQLATRTMAILVFLCLGSVILVVCAWLGARTLARVKNTAAIPGVDFPHVTRILVESTAIACLVFPVRCVFIEIVGTSRRSIRANALRLSVIDAVLAFTI